MVDDRDEYILSAVFMMGAVILGSLALAFREMGLSETPGRVATWTMLSFFMAFVFLPGVLESIERKGAAVRRWLGGTNAN